MVWLVLEVRRGYYLPVGPFSKLLYDLKSFKDLQQHKHSQLNQLNQLSQLQLCTKASPRSSCLYRSFIIIYHTKPLAAMLQSLASGMATFGTQERAWNAVET